MTNRNVPRLRFNEFIDDWNMGRLGDLSKKVLEKNTNLDNDNILTDSAYYGVINQREFFDKDISRLDASQNYTVVKPNQYIYNPRISREAKFGPIKRNKLGYEGIVSPLYYVFTISNDLNYNFFDNFFDSDKWHHFIYRRGNTGARSDRVAIKDRDLEDMYIKYPNLSEQQQIGNFLSKLDYLIDLHSQKLEQLKKLKRGYLQKMFLQKGETVPCLRFSGFSGDWKEVLLGEVLNERNDKKVESDEYPLKAFISGVGVSSKGEKYDRSALVKDKNKKYKITKLNDFIYSSNNFNTGSIGLNWNGNATISPVYSIFYTKNNNSPYFINYLAQNKLFLYKMSKYQQGVTYGQRRIKEKDFLNISERVPSYEEQIKIGDFFYKIDCAMDLENSKIKQLKQQKKAYLQKMFI